MPARPPIANVIKVEYLWTQSGAPAANVLHLGYSSAPPSSTDLGSLANSFAALWSVNVPLMSTYCPPNTILDEVVCTDLSSDSSAIGSYVDGSAGSSVGQPLSAGSAFLVNWLITRRYRGGHPRTYWPAWTSNLIQTSTAWYAGTVSEMAEKMTALRSLVEHQTIGALTTTTLGAVSYYTGNSPRVAPIFESFVGFRVNGLVATQRRRIRSSSF